MNPAHQVAYQFGLTAVQVRLGRLSPEDTRARLVEMLELVSLLARQVAAGDSDAELGAWVRAAILAQHRDARRLN